MLNVYNKPLTTTEELLSLTPYPIDQGASGSYFLIDRPGSTPVGIFKPLEEEVGMPGNMKGYTGSPAKKGHEVGTAYIKEIAAYELTEGSYLAIVPYTRELTLPGLGKGSFQVFVSGRAPDPFDERPWKSISDRSLEQKLLFDMAFANMDRHFGNMLIDKENLYLIDHGYAFSHNLDWYSPRERSETFTYAFEIRPGLKKKKLSAEARAWIAGYSLEDKCAHLRKLGMPESVIREHRVRITFLKTAAKYPLPLRKMARCCMAVIEEGREYLPDTFLPLAHTLQTVSKAMGPAKYDYHFTETLEVELDKIFAQSLKIL